MFVDAASSSIGEILAVILDVLVFSTCRLCGLLQRQI
jgi:hypothetical protein